MSRKSQRILSRGGALQIPNILNRKRKIGELTPEEQVANESASRKRQLYGLHKTAFQSEDSDDDDDQCSTKSGWISDGLSRRYSQLTCTPTPTTRAHTRYPLPEICWGDPVEVWEAMIEKETYYSRDPKVLERHPAILPRMRSILFDWLMEVAQAHKMHRETFYLAMDCVDRYLATQNDVPKHLLQLIGITCLFIASKTEEIYPAKLEDFSFVTDGACTMGEIVSQEMIVLKALKWEITPMTALSWLNTFMQLSNKENMKNSKENFEFPNYSGLQFIQITKLVDLCMLDEGSLQFAYRVIAASAFYHMTSQALFDAVTGFQLHEVQSCVEWMTPFAMIVRESGWTAMKFHSEVAKDDQHNIQTHNFDLALLESAQERQALILSSVGNSPSAIAGILTPPPSREK